MSIPKGDGRFQPLNTPAVRDRTVQTAATLPLEPILDADFRVTASFEFRPGFGPQEALDAVREHARTVPPGGSLMLISSSCSTDWTTSN